MTPDQYHTLNVAAMADQGAADFIATGEDQSLADWLNTPDAFVVWKSSVPVADVFDAVLWANMTPAIAPDDTQLWTNRNLQCQSKQLQLQTFLIGRETLNPSKSNIRAGMQDALTNLPSKADGTNQNAGWTAVLALFKRTTTRAEMILASGTGTDATPGLLGWEGLFDAASASTVRVS